MLYKRASTISRIIFMLTVLLARRSTTAYKPVVIVHGIMDEPNSLNMLMDRIAEKHAGTNVTIIHKLHGWRSMAPLWFQVKSFKKILEPIMEENPGGVNLIGFSQGGLIARAIIQSTNKHNVHTFISLSAPQGGQYGDDFLRIYFPGYVKQTAWRFFYSRPGQLTSVGNYWRDPHHLDSFHNYTHFLPELNNEVDSPYKRKFRRNFLKLQRLVLVGGPDDGVISPWQSSQFGVYDENENVVPMRDTELYKSDTIGLRTLDKLCKVVTITVPGIHHLEWHKNNSVIDDYIVPYLD